MAKHAMPSSIGMPQESGLNEKYRRNGKLQACEPCRRGKLRCDHTVPTCTRCVRRNKAEQCVYHPAPLTKPKPLRRAGSDILSSPSVDLPTPSSSSHTPHQQSSALTPQETIQQQNPPPLLNRRRADRPYGKTRGDDPILDVGTPGFLGPTSFADILTENQAPLGIDTNPKDLSPPSLVTESRIERGARVLLRLSDEKLVNECIDRWFSAGEGVIVNGAMVKQWSAELYAAHRQTLRSGKTEQHHALSRLIWENTSKPLKFDRHTTPRQWTSLSSGHNLRWEVVGMIMTIVGLLGMTLWESDPFFNFAGEDGPVDRNDMSRDVGAAAETCMMFCRDLSLLNDLVIWFMYENNILVGRFWGLSAAITWQRTGELNNSLIAMGLHQKIEQDEHTPWFLTQYRKKAFVFNYAFDKSLATFLGRPPRLSKRYCLLQYPLDLSDPQLMSDEPYIHAAPALLDEDGWNKKGEIQRCTLARIYAQDASIREDILELSLGVLQLSPSAMFERAHQIQSEADRAFASLPSFLRRTTDSLWDPRKSILESLTLIFVRIKHLEHGFLLQRTLVKRAGAENMQLLRYAHMIFANSLCMITHLDFFHDFQIDVAMIIAGYGLPSVAAIAVALLHQESLSGSSQQGSLQYTLPRSRTIQDICVFTSYLAGLHTDGDSFAIAKQAQKFLSAILDKILSPAPRPELRRDVEDHNPSTVQNQAVHGESDITMSEAGGAEMPMSLDLGGPFFTSGTDAEFARWLDSVVWDTEGIPSFGS